MSRLLCAQVTCLCGILALESVHVSLTDKLSVPTPPHNDVVTGLIRGAGLGFLVGLGFLGQGDRLSLSGDRMRFWGVRALELEGLEGF